MGNIRDDYTGCWDCGMDPCICHSEVSDVGERSRDGHPPMNWLNFIASSVVIIAVVAGLVFFLYGAGTGFSPWSLVGLVGCVVAFAVGFWLVGKTVQSR